MGHDVDIAVLSSWHHESVWPDGGSYLLTADDFRRIAALLPPQVLLLASPVQDWLAQIDPAEQAIIRNAVPRRQAEFSTGRILASTALRQFDCAAFPILAGSMNEPVWPKGIVGSISHTTDTCMVAVAAAGDAVGIGLDLEGLREEFGEIGHLVLRPDDAGGVSSGGLVDEDLLRIVFSAKEAVYKAISAQVGRFVDFLEVRLDLHPGDSRFQATAPEDAQLDLLLRRGAGHFDLTKDYSFAYWGQS